MLKYKLSGVWFVLAVVHIHLELIGLHKDDEERHCNKPYLKETDVLLKTSTYPSHKTVTHIFRKLLILLQFFEENTDGKKQTSDQTTSYQPTRFQKPFFYNKSKLTCGGTHRGPACYQK